MAKITYADKVNSRTISTPTNEKIGAADMNMIKQSVNALYDAKRLLDIQSSLNPTEAMALTLSTGVPV